MITVHNLTKTYLTPVKSGNILKDIFAREHKGYTAVDHISFEVEQNELIGFIGPNGAGKTTTLKMLSGILYPTSGTVQVLGYTPFEKNYAYLKQIGFVMGQKNQLLWDLPAMDSFRVNKEIYEISDTQYKKTLHELMELLEVRSFIDQPVKTLSLGQRMRVEFIASLIHRPKVLYLDEPTIGLDIFAQTTIRQFIKEYQQRYQATILLTSHYMQDVQHLASRVLLIDKGRIIYDGTLNQLVERYSQNKQITVVVAKKLKHVPTILKSHTHSYDDPRLQFSVKKEELPKVLFAVLKEVEYLDVTIENESIEDVIKKTFADTSSPGS
jgi:ABC-2 type transport system ATP-binding protein